VAVRLIDHVAIVTGAGHGIGQATAQRLAAEGARVVVADIDEDAGATSTADIEANGCEALFVGVDVMSAADVDKMVAHTIEAFGRVDILVNNAGILRMGAVEELSEDDWRLVIDTNLTGVFLCSKAVIPAMRRQGGGCIVNIASGAGLVGVRRSAAYCASKGGVVLLTKAMALDYEPDAIRVNAVCPGAVDTQLMEHKWRFEGAVDLASARRDYEAALPLRRMLYPEEIAHQVMFLASHDSYPMTGHCLVI
jgi:NAD(P)-dependent dehydrogenase (short-subunit alcohol dehydrogenase family)